MNLETHRKVSLQIGWEHGGMKRKQYVIIVESGGFSEVFQMA